MTGVETIRLEPDGRTKTERRQQQREDSVRWAESFSGKQVVVSRPRRYLETSKFPNATLQGEAYRITNAAGGWGQVVVKLNLTDAEVKRNKEVARGSRSEVVGHYQEFYLYRYPGRVGKPYYWGYTVSYADRDCLRLA